jgi:hypothetical protein
MPNQNAVLQLANCIYDAIGSETASYEATANSRRRTMIRIMGEILLAPRYTLLPRKYMSNRANA